MNFLIINYILKFTKTIKNYTMKKTLLSILSIFLLSVSSHAQVGATAPDFTVTDLDGNTHNLYSILNSGKVVILDCSTTWCSTCWSMHGGHYLEDIHNTYGPNGTDQVRVLFYEADASTTLANLQGTGNTQGNWLSGSSYPFVNESPLSLSGSIYWPLGFPTVNVISPSDKKIKADLYDPWAAGDGLAGMVDIIDNYFTSTSSVDEEETLSNVNVYPNPSNNVANLTFASNSNTDANITIYNVIGEIVYQENKSVQVGDNLFELNVNSFSNGNYIVRVEMENEIITTKFDVIR